MWGASFCRLLSPFRSLIPDAFQYHVLGTEIRFDARRFTRVEEDRFRIDDLEAGGSTELRLLLPAWSIEVPSRRRESVVS